MGNVFEKNAQQQPIFDVNEKCNYNCPTCQKSGRTPNMAGRFFIINDLECKCNACDSIFPKERYFKIVIDNAHSSI
jgi:hypothetical protein